jgi:hypothetical protein
MVRKHVWKGVEVAGLVAGSDETRNGHPAAKDTLLGNGVRGIRVT